MNMQQMMMQAQKMQRELKKAMEDFAIQEYEIEKAGIVKIVMNGAFEIVSLEIDKDALDPENKDMIEETIIMALNEIKEAIENDKNEINEKITGNPGGLGF